MVRVTAAGSRSFSPSADEAFVLLLRCALLGLLKKTRVGWDEMRSVWVVSEKTVGGSA
jgi:hypothetical protein